MTVPGQNHTDLLPPELLQKRIGGGDFRLIGERFLRFFIDVGNLQPHERVLDVGCGCGRMAAPLTRYVNRCSVYEGFDVCPEAVGWCQENISAHHPHFHFRHLDVRNRCYNRAGEVDGAKVRFPFRRGSFDFVCLTSVFTHLLPSEMENYLSEGARVLTGNGRMFCTFFLLNDEAFDLIARGKSQMQFPFADSSGVCRYENAEAREAGVAFREGYIRTLFTRHGLIIHEPIRYGHWCGRDGWLDYQDIIVASKQSSWIDHMKRFTRFVFGR